MSIGTLLSVQPKWWHLIKEGRKTGELRKSFPELKTPFKVYVYCTKKQSLLSIMKDGDECYGETYHGKPVFLKTHDGYYGEAGRIVGEFTCKGIIRLTYTAGKLDVPEVPEDLQCCTELTPEVVNGYLKGKTGYVWHISDVITYSSPKKLEDFGMKRPPQSWQYLVKEDGRK